MKGVAFALIAGLALASCSGEEPTVEGVWKLENRGHDLVLADDGVLSLSAEDKSLGDPISGSWKKEGEQIAVTIPGREEHEIVAIGVDPSTVAMGRKLVREEIGPRKASVPSGDPEIDQPNNESVLHLYFQEEPQVFKCEYELNAKGEEPRLSMDCGALFHGDFVQ